MKAIFITGTDTGVGKTIVTGCLARFLLEQGYNVITQKWIETGCKGKFSSDIQSHLKIMGRHKNDIKDYLDYISPYKFRVACSPHLASKIENKRIDAKKIIKSFKLLSYKFDFVLVEGIGGVLVPFNKKSLVIDIAKELDLPALVIVCNKLGAINHTLLTIEALRARKIKILGILFNNFKNEDNDIIEDNPRIIKRLTKQEIFGVLHWQSRYDRLYKSFIPIGNRIWKKVGLIKI